MVFRKSSIFLDEVSGNFLERFIKLWNLFIGMHVTKTAKEMKREFLAYDIVIYGSIALLLLWCLLKAVGVINTPEYQKLLPIFFGAVAFAGTVLKSGKTFGYMQSDINWLKRGFTKIDRRQNRMAAVLISVEHDLDRLKRD